MDRELWLRERVERVKPDAHLGASEDPDSILGHGI